MNGVSIRLLVQGPGVSKHQHQSAIHIEAIQAWVLIVLVVEVVEFQVSQLARVLTSHRSVEIVVVVGSKSSQKAGRGVQALLVVDPEEKRLGKRDCGPRNMVIELVDLEVVLIQTSYSREVAVPGEVCD